MSDDDSLRHISRQRPSWATGPMLTECGHLVNDTVPADTPEEFRAYVDTLPQKRLQRAYATHCMTCVDTTARWARKPTASDREMQAVRRYLEGRGPVPRRRSRRDADPSGPDRRAVELAVIAELVRAHWDEYTEAVEARMAGDIGDLSVARQARRRGVRR